MADTPAGPHDSVLPDSPPPDSPPPDSLLPGSLLPDSPPPGSAPPEFQYQSLYRRFRPQRFADVRGQEHVTRALRNTVRDARVSHAYLFSGPRGTGKTSTARILAMALNCEHPDDGEPDGTCASCVDIRRGVSVDVQELDAASNRRIDEMRDLLSRVALGTRGRWKVYIIDEVHQLTPDAASALLKTLEEPPPHVVFLLATTDPQKVLPTIRSRTIPFEFHLLASEVLGDLVRDINKEARLGITPDAIELVVRRGNGSARDALTVLDQVAAGGGVDDQAEVATKIVDGVADRDPGRVLAAVAEGITAGRDPRRMAADLLEHLRNGFLATMARDLVMLPDDAVAEIAAQARRLGLAALVRAMEVIGAALAEMRDSVDSRVTLEVALVRLSRPDSDVSPAALLERIERLERARAAGDTRGATSPVPTPHVGERTLPAPPPVPSASAHIAPFPPVSPPPPAAPRVVERPLPAPPPPPAAERTLPSQPPPPAAERALRGTVVAPLPSRDELTKAWGDTVLRRLAAKAKVYLQSGRFVGVEAECAVFALPNQEWLNRSRDGQAEAEAALAAYFGRPVPLRMVVESAAPAVAQTAEPEPAEEVLDRRDLDYLQDADTDVISPEQRLLDAFPGAEEVST